MSDNGAGQDFAFVTPDMVKAVWSEVLALPPGGIDDDTSWFRLGGTSLQAAVMLRTLGERLGLQVPLELILQASTPATLAAALHGLPVEEEGWI